MSSPLAVRVQGTGSFDLVRFKQGLDAEVLATVAGALTGTVGNQRPSRAAQIGNRLFWIANGRVYQKTGTGSVTEKLDLATSTAQSGWIRYYLHPTNGPGLFGCTTAATGKLILYDYLTDTWSTVNLGVNTGAGASTQTLVVMNNVGYYADRIKIYTLDPVAQSFVSTTVSQPIVLNPYNSILYALRANVTNALPYELGQFLGGVFVALTDVTGSQTSTGSTDDEITRALIYQIGGDTYVACNADATNDGWVAGKWDGTTYTDLTNTLLPPQLRPGGSLANTSPDRWRAHSWKVQEGNTTRTFIHLSLGHQSTASLLYEHVGATWVLRNSSQWGNHYSYFLNPEAGGDLYYDSTELNAVKISKEVAVANGMELEYHVNGDEGTADTFAALFYSKDGGGTWLRATLLAPSGGTGGGSSISGNNLINVDADGDGLTPTTYTIIHDWTTDGLGSLDSAWWQLRCSKTVF